MDTILSLESYYSAISDKIKNDNRPLLTFNFVNIPIEILSCFGNTLPWSLYLHLFEENIKMINNLPSDYCDIAKMNNCFTKNTAILQKNLFPIFGLLCGVSLRMSEEISKHNNCFLMDFPRVQRRNIDKQYLFHEYCRMIDYLEKATGIKLNMNVLKESIEKRNQLKVLIKKILDTRKLKNPPINAVEAREIYFGQYLFPSEEYIKLLSHLDEKINKRIEQKYCPYKKSDSRVYLLGPVTSEMVFDKNSNNFIKEFISGVESVGFAIVDDSGYYLKEINISPNDSLEALLIKLSGYYFDYPATNFQVNNFENIERIIDNTMQNAIDAAIYCNIKFCETSAYDVGKYEQRFKSIECPFLKLEIGAEFKRQGQLSTRLETFKEIL